jgi:hypothetical protein
MKPLQKYRIHPYCTAILSSLRSIILISRSIHGYTPITSQWQKGPQQIIPSLAVADFAGRGKTSEAATTAQHVILIKKS